MTLLARSRAGMLLALAVWGARVMVSDPADAMPEAQVKAAFLLNFLKFVEWPDPDDRPWVIGVVGREPIGEALEVTVRGKQIAGKSVVVRKFRRAADAMECHILFVPRAEWDRGQTPARAGLLTVGDAPGFIDAGGVIGFYTISNKLRFAINAEAARAAGLHVSAQLLKLGTAP